LKTPTVIFAGVTVRLFDCAVTVVAEGFAPPPPSLEELVLVVVVVPGHVVEDPVPQDAETEGSGEDLVGDR
jgi:hypothetical protein